MNRLEVQTRVLRILLEQVIGLPSVTADAFR